uniref:Uncharacterized protein n=1 Tax=Ditylenchus dipsaci TaxID=166011 RepID=A0A915DLE4_9BILA
MLFQALLDEGLDPSTYSFNLLDVSLQEGTPLKKQLRSTSMDCATPTDQPSADCSIKEEPMDTTTATTTNQPQEVNQNIATEVDQPVDQVVDIPAAATEEVVIEDGDDDADEPVDKNKKLENEEQMPKAEEAVKIEETENYCCCSHRCCDFEPKKASDKNGDNDPAASTWTQSLWIKGISNTTKAADLKMLFRKVEQNQFKGQADHFGKGYSLLLPQINKAAKPQPVNKPVPVTAPSAASQLTKEQPAKPQDSQKKDDSPEVIIESFTPATPTAKRPPVKALTTNGAKKGGEATPNDSDSPAAAAKSTSLHRSSRPLSRRFIPTSSNSYQQKLSRSATNKYVLSRYNNRGEGATTANLRLHSTQRRPLEFSTSRGAGQLRVSRGGGPAALPATPPLTAPTCLQKEREKLEVKQLKLTAQLANAQFAFISGGNRSSEADISRRSSKAVDRPDKSYKHTAAVSSGFIGNKNNKYSEDRSRRDDRMDKPHRSRSRSHVKDGKDTNNGYKSVSSSLSKFGYNSKQQGSSSIDQYNQQVSRFIESSALPASRSEQQKTYGRSADAAKPDFAGRGVRGVREVHTELLLTFLRHELVAEDRQDIQKEEVAEATTETSLPAIATRAALDSWLHSSNGAGRNADEMFGGLNNYNTSSIGARDNTNSYRDVSSYQSTLVKSPNWVGGGGSRAFIAPNNNTGASPTASTANSWQQQAGNNSFWGGGSSVGRSSNAEWGGNALSSNQQQPTNQASRYSFDNNKHSSYSRRY